MNCGKCKLHKTRKRVVSNFGSNEADVLVILDYPSNVDETLGTLFSGKVKLLFKKMLMEASQALGKPVPGFYVTAILKCRPTDKKNGDSREPKTQEILACAPQFFSSLSVNPYKCVFFVGKLVDKFYRKEFTYARVLQSIHFLEQQGGNISAWYQTNLRIMMEALDEA